MEFEAYLHGAIAREQRNRGIELDPPLNCPVLDATGRSTEVARNFIGMGMVVGSTVIGLNVIPLLAQAGMAAEGDSVEQLQELLASKGFDPGPIDGLPGPATEAATIQAQTFYGLTVDGIPGEATLAALQSDPYGTSTPAEEDSYVAYVQKLLQQRGFYQGAIDGIAGDATTTAIAAAQMYYGIAVDGVVGDVTLRALESGDVELAVSENVKTVQTKLAQKGYYAGPIDGIQGELTTAAIVSFQNENQLTVDGVAGSETMTALNKA